MPNTLNKPLRYRQVHLDFHTSEHIPGIGADFAPAFPLTIPPEAEWLPWLAPEIWVSGPGLRKYLGKLPPGTHVVEEDRREPQSESLLQLGLARYLRGERDDVWAVEPLYLRPSSAEEQWKNRTVRA